MQHEPLARVVDLGAGATLLRQLDRDAIVVERVPSVERAFEGEADLVLVDGAAVEAALAVREIEDAPLPLVVGVTGDIGNVPEIRSRGADDVLVLGDYDPTSQVATLARTAGCRRELEARRRASAVINDLAAAFDYSAELEDTLNDSLASIVELTRATRAVCVVVSGPDRTMFLMGASDDPSAVGVMVSERSFSEIEPALESRSSVCIDLFRGDARLPRARNSAEKGLLEPSGPDDLAFESLHLEPLLCNGEAVGVLELYLRPSESLSPIERELARAMAALLAPRIFHSERYRSLREQTKRRRVVAIEGEATLATLRKYKEFFERASDGIAVLDEEGRVFYLNPAGEEITGYAAHGIAGLPFEDVVAARDRPLLRVLIERSGELWGEVADLHLMTTSGDPIIVSVAVSDSAIRQGLTVFSFRDVTESRALAEELRHTKEFLERLIDSTVDAIVAADVDGTIILFNKGAERLYGMREGDVLGVRQFADLFPQGVAEKVFERLRGEQDGGVGRLEMVREEILNAERDMVPVRLSASLIYEGSAEVGMVATFSDLRERLHIERRLVRAQERLAETEKQALIAELAGTTAHELNQPLTSVMGYAELLKRKMSADDANQRAADRIMQECQRLADIVRKIGKITRYETKNYVGGTQILDLDKASDDSP